MHAITRAVALSQSGLPTDFRLFKRGVNTTAKGDFLFDDIAAASVIAAYKRAGVDLPVDLEHLSLSPDSSRSDSHDARGWFQLAVKNGELWAVNVRWNSDGVARLTNKTQRYISPAFVTDADGRVTQLVNCALVAHPATHGAPALVAASRTAILSARVTPARRAALYLLASKRGTTISAILLNALELVSSERTTPTTPEALAALKALLATLGLSPDASQPEVIAAVKSLLGPAPEEFPDVDPLAQMPDLPVPAKLASDLAARGMSHTEFLSRKAALLRRTPSKPKANSR